MRRHVGRSDICRHRVNNHIVVRGNIKVTTISRVATTITHCNRYRKLKGNAMECTAKNIQ